MKYLGSKNISGLYQAIINIMPPHDIYIEPFLGTGYIMRKKMPALYSIGIDKNKNCIDAFDYPAVFKSKEPGPEIELINGDAFEFLSEYEFKGTELIYLDPPYPHSTRTSNKKYKYELTDNQHVRLLKLLRGIDCYKIISTYINGIYANALHDWSYFDMQVMTHGGIRTERVYFSYDLAAVHFHQYAGNNFTDRQRIKRKAERWQKNFAKLPPGERQAILAALLSLDKEL